MASLTDQRRLLRLAIAAGAFGVGWATFAAPMTSAWGAACTIHGTSGNNTIRGTAGNDIICGHGGDDVIYGLGGNDIIYGGTGNDRIYGGAGDDQLHGEAGNDDLRGEDGKDRLAGGDGADVLYGGNHNDTLYGGGGNDTVKGEAGDDTVKGEAGDDKVYGDSGHDQVYGDSGHDTIYGGSGNDALYGGTGNDTLYGQDGNDTLRGEDGNDTLWGGNGDDGLNGGAGNDALNGDAGNDSLNGASGNDGCAAGSGRADTIHDFNCQKRSGAERLAPSHTAIPSGKTQVTCTDTSCLSFSEFSSTTKPVAGFGPCTAKAGNVHNCTFYAAYRLSRRVTTGYSFTYPTGNAYQWNDDGRRGSLKVVSRDTPSAGDLAHWETSGLASNDCGAINCGHVGYVERVNYDSNGAVASIVVSESSWCKEGRVRIISRSGSGWPTRFLRL